MPVRSIDLGDVYDGTTSPKVALISQDESLAEAEERLREEERVRLKVDRSPLYHCKPPSLNLLDSNIISSASVTSMLHDLGLDQGNRCSVSILIFTVASVCFQLPATLAVRMLGSRLFFALTSLRYID